MYKSYAAIEATKQKRFTMHALLCWYVAIHHLKFLGCLLETDRAQWLYNVLLMYKFSNDRIVYLCIQLNILHFICNRYTNITITLICDLVSVYIFNLFSNVHNWPGRSLPLCWEHVIIIRYCSFVKKTNVSDLFMFLLLQHQLAMLKRWTCN